AVKCTLLTSMTERRFSRRYKNSTGWAGRKYAYKDAREFWLIHQGTRYDSKAIVGVACKHVTGSKGPLKASEFSGGKATVQRLLESLGFEVEVRKSKNAELSQ